MLEHNSKSFCDTCLLIPSVWLNDHGRLAQVSLSKNVILVFDVKEIDMILCKIPTIIIIEVSASYLRLPGLFLLFLFTRLNEKASIPICYEEVYAFIDFLIKIESQAEDHCR